jgi:hypothetical protein
MANGAAKTPLTPKVPFTPITPKVPAAAIPSQVSTLTNLRAATSTGTGINFLLKEQIDALTDAMSTNALNALGDEQARLRELRIAERPGIGAGSMFDPAFFRRGEEKATLIT